MTGTEYQHTAVEFPTKYPESLGAFYTVLGMNKTTGELSNILMGILEKNDSSITEKERNLIGTKLGYLLYYIAKTADSCALTLDKIMQDNIDLMTYNRDKMNILNDDIFSKK